MIHDLSKIFYSDLSHIKAKKFKNSIKFKKWVIDTQKNSEAINHKLDLYI